MRAIYALLKPLALPVALIVAVSAYLLYMDKSGAPKSDTNRMPRVALVQHASQSALDDGVAGLINALEKRGYIDGKTMILEKFNAHADVPTANDIGRRVTDGSYDLVLSVSTLSLQAVANANRQRKVRHVFGVVTDPASAGVGVSRSDPLDHPPYMTGLGSFTPVDKPLQLALQMNPRLKRIGLVWNTAESNSKASVEATRAECIKLGLELIEANAENSSAVGEAASSLVSRGVDALFVIGDVTVLTGIEGLIAAARRGHVPVFTNIPPQTRKGALFDLGADYVAVGAEVGTLAADVLEGLDPAKTPVVNRVPEILYVNLLELEKVKDRWRLPPGFMQRRSIIIDANGERINAGGAAK